jgi:hypothetical protein
LGSILYELFKTSSCAWYRLDEYEEDPATIISKSFFFANPSITFLVSPELEKFSTHESP